MYPLFLEAGRAVYSKFNLAILSFLCQRGFVSDFRLFRKGPGGYIMVSLRRNNGSLGFNKIWSPTVHDNKPSDRFYKYKKSINL